MDDLHLTLFGGFQARTAAGNAVTPATWKARAVLAYLAVRADRPHSRDQLASLFWETVSQSQARKALRQTLFWLRRALPGRTVDCLRVDTQTVCLVSTAVHVDVAAFERLATGSTPADLERAIGLYRGDLLEGLTQQAAPFEEWLVAERERLREIALEALSKLVAHHQAHGADEAALAAVQRILALDPLQEAAHRAAMRLCLRVGRRAAALRQYGFCADILRRELAVEPEAETQELYRSVLRRRDGVGEAAAIPALTVATGPFIGRAREVEQLREALRRTSRGRGSVVAVVGESGIGKSRLVMEAATAAIRGGTRVLVGHCRESQQILPLAPWAEILRAAWRGGDEAILGAIHPRWTTPLSRLIPELVVVTPPVLDSPDQLQVFESVAQVLESLAARRGLTLVLEDVHWADETSLRLLSFLGPRLRAWPALLIATAREEELAGAPELRRIVHELQDGAHLTLIPLSALSREETFTLAEALSASAAEAAVWAMSAGNPFVVVEAARSFTDGAALDGLGRLPVPDRVRRVIERRLDHLSDRGRSIVDAAAVIEGPFTFEVIRRVAALREEEAAQAVEEALQRGIFREIEAEFAFSHDRVRTVARGRLRTLRRRLFHRHVAEALEATQAPNTGHLAATLGLHYHEAGVWDRALFHLTRAGIRARHETGLRESVRLLDLALLAVAHLSPGQETTEREVDVRLALDQALVPLGELDAALAHLRRAERLSTELEDQRRRAAIAVRLCDKLRFAGKFDLASESGHRGLQASMALGDGDITDEAHFFLGMVHELRGQYRAALDHLGATVDAMEGAPIERRGRPPYLPALTHLSTCLAELGEFTTAHEHARRALAMAEDSGDPLGLANASLASGAVHFHQGTTGSAIPFLERTVELSGAHHLGHVLPLAVVMLACAYGRAGQVTDAARRLLEAGRRFEISSGMRITRPRWLAWRAEALALAGRTPEARALAERALALASSGGEQHAEAEAMKLVADLARRQEPPALAAAAGGYADALSLASRLELRPLAAHCHLALAEVLQLANPVEALEHTATATAMYREMGMRPPDRTPLAVAETPQ